MSARVVVGNLGEHIKAAVLAELREYPRNVQLRESRALDIRARVAGGGGYSETGPVQGGPGGAVGDRYLEALERDPYWRWLDLKVQVVDQALQYVRRNSSSGVILDQYLLDPWNPSADRAAEALSVAKATVYRRAGEIVEAIAPFLFGPFGQVVGE